MLTSCKDCVFAKYRDNVQYGCEFARLERFQMNGGITLCESKYVTGKDARERNWPQADSIGYWDIAEYAVENGNENKPLGVLSPKIHPLGLDKDNKKYYLIHRFCTRCRNQEWAKNLSEDEAKEKAIAESKIKLCVVGALDEFRLEWLQEFVKSISTQELPVNEVIILNCLGIKCAGSISEAMEQLSAQYNIETYKIVSVISSQTLKTATNELLGENKIQSPWLSLFRLPYAIPENFAKQIDIALNERLEQFVYLKGNQGMTITTGLFNILSGYKEIELFDNKMSDLEEKVKVIAKENDQNYLVKDLSEIVH